MKKIYFFICALSIYVCANAQTPSLKNIIPLQQKNNYFPVQLQNQFRTNSTNYRVVEVILDTYAAPDWSPYEKVTYTYSNNRGGNFSTLLSSSTPTRIPSDVATYDLWDGTLYSPTYQDFQNFNAINQPTDYTSTQWNISGYENSYLYTYEYVGGNLDKETGFDWDGTTWVNSEMFEYFYTAGVLDYILYYYWDGLLWQLYTRDIYLFDETGNLTSIESQEWDGIAYATFSFTTFSYMAGQLSTVTRSYDSGSGLEYFSRNIYTYSGSDLSSLLLQNYSSGSWDNAYEYVLEYDTNDELIVLNYNQDSGSDFEPYYRYTFTNETYTAIQNTPENMHLTLGPNPATDYVNLSFDNTEHANIEMQINDISGNLVYSSTSSANNFTWNLTGNDKQKVASGVYQLTLIKNNTPVVSEKIMVM